MQPPAHLPKPPWLNKLIHFELCTARKGPSDHLSRAHHHHSYGQCLKRSGKSRYIRLFNLSLQKFATSRMLQFSLSLQQIATEIVNSFIESIRSLWWRQKLLKNHYLATLLTTINSLECGNYYRSVRGTLASRSVVNGPLKDGVNKSRTIDELQGVSPWRGFFTPLSLLLLILFGGLRLTIASQGRGGWCWFQAHCVWHIFMVQLSA